MLHVRFYFGTRLEFLRQTALPLSTSTNGVDGWCDEEDVKEREKLRRIIQGLNRV